MKTKTLLLVICLIMVNNSIHAQVSRIRAMGDVSIAIDDRTNSLNLFDYGKNPAWLCLDESDSYLEVTPGFSKHYGDYRRYYSAEQNNFISTDIYGVKTLDTLSTFLGYSNYTYENRVSYNRSLKMNPYSGEAFFMTDTTSGDFRYNGPEVALMYSWELLPNLFAGANVSYQIMDGLKKVFTYAETLYRNVGVNAGLAYKFSEDFALGVIFDMHDSQESIESSDVNLLSVTIYNYRGEKYSIMDRGSTSEERVKKRFYTVGLQSAFKPFDALDVAFKGSIHTSHTKVDIPQGYLIEFEEGYSSFTQYDMDVASRLHLTDQFSLGVTGHFYSGSNWSKITEKQLLIWEWEGTQISGGIGASYLFDELPLMVAADYRFESVSSDSSKYIDGILRDITSANHILKAGLEAEVSEDFFVRAGLKYGSYEHDFLFGGKDVTVSSYTVGVGIPVLSSMSLDTYFEFMNMTPGANDNSRSYLNAFVTLRFNYF